jgi:hypothetical protein
MQIAVDFDGVIHDNRPAAIPAGRRMGPPIPGALDAIRALVSGGHTVTIFTARAKGPTEVQAVAQWLSFFGFPPNLAITNRKLSQFQVFIDDRAVHFTDWPETLAKVKEVPWLGTKALE